MTKRLFRTLLALVVLSGISLSVTGSIPLVSQSAWAVDEIVVKVEMVGQGSVSLNPAPISSDPETKTYIYETTTNLIATATPGQGFEFYQWSGSVSSSSTSDTFPLSGADPSVPFILQAQFKKKDTVPGVAMIQRFDPVTPPTGRTLLISSTDLGPAVADMDHNGIVDADDTARFTKCGNGFAGQPTGYDAPDPGWANPIEDPLNPGVFGPDPDLRRCGEADLDGDGDVDGNDLAIFNSCLADPNHPLPGHACFGASAEVGAYVTWVEITGPESMVLSSSGGADITQALTAPGRYTIKTAVIDQEGNGCRDIATCYGNDANEVADSAWRVVQLFMPMTVKLTLRVDADADVAGTVSVDVTGLTEDGTGSCNLTNVGRTEQTCWFLIDQQIGIHAVPNDSLGYQFVQWQVYDNGDAPNDLDQTNPGSPPGLTPNTVTLAWTDFPKGYKLQAVIASEDTP